MKSEKEIAEYFKAASNETLIALQNEHKTVQYNQDMIVGKDFYEYCFGFDFNSSDILRVSHYKTVLQSYLIDELICRIK
jgi:hypothetical protein